MWNKLLERLWRLLPDNCQHDYCEGHGVRGNENLYPRAGTLKPIVLCDYCSVRYDKEGQLMVNGYFVNKRMEDELLVREQHSEQRATP